VTPRLLQRGNSRYIQFAGKTGRRKTVSLGPVSDKAARAALYHVERLAESAFYGTPLSADTAEWLEKVPAKLRVKLVKVGIAKRQEEKPSTLLGEFIDRYIAGRTDVKQNTTNILKQTRRFLVAFFGAARDLTTINKGEAKDWERGMRMVLSEATAAAYLKRARMFFADALDRKLIGENPFVGIKAGSQVNESRRVFVSPADVLKVMDECPDAEWRVIFALARWGGLRVPSETQQLRWSDINFGTGRMIVRSPKTEKQGKASREVPIFPELLPWLREAFDQSDGAAHVVTRHRGENLRTTTMKFIDRAGLTPWPKLFQNLRSSRQTELEDEHPTHVVCRWLGNSPTIARRHYLQTTDRHFEKALGSKSAAQGAALRPAVEHPVAHQNNENPARNSNTGDDQCPRWGPNKHVFSQGIEGVKGPALRRALRRLRQTAYSIYGASTAPYRSRPHPRPAPAAERGQA
jgi:hypothetical protein